MGNSPRGLHRMLCRPRFLSKPVERFPLRQTIIDAKFDMKVHKRTMDDSYFKLQGKAKEVLIMVYYSVFSQELFAEGSGSYIGWGIEGREEDGNPAGRVEDLTEDREFALLVAAALNREQAEPVHLRDILEDLLEDPQAREALLQYRERDPEN